MLCHVALVRTNVSEECTATITRVTKIGKLGTVLAVTSNKACCEEMSVLTRATQRNIPENGILHSHRRENLKSYRVYCGFLGSS
jgi:hypothetical protein